MAVQYGVRICRLRTDRQPDQHEREWIRLSNRNAATDATDIVSSTRQARRAVRGLPHRDRQPFLFRMPEHSFTDPLGTGPVSYEQDSPDLFVPNVCTAYTSDKWSLFAGVHIPGGGATLDYPDGSYTTRLIGAGLIGPGGPYEGVYTAITNESLEAESLSTWPPRSAAHTR
jgi:long-chain fatty acid transport protein